MLVRLQKYLAHHGIASRRKCEEYIEKGFIKAEVYHYDDLIRLKSEQAIREAGLLRLEGKEYMVNDGDIVNFKFNV